MCITDVRATPILMILFHRVLFCTAVPTAVSLISETLYFEQLSLRVSEALIS